MILLKRASDLHKHLEAQRKVGSKIGFVPTMGALHAGHVSLIGESKDANDITVCSIFVNPTQFNDPKDFEKYPVTIDKDIYMLEAAGCDVLLLPAVTEIYPGEFEISKYELGFLETILEGKFRPGHFQGVCMVVHRLLEIVQPNNLYLGQKDYQQCMVITRLLELIGMKDRVAITISPTLREPDGLAMSSRNMRLSTEERKRAPAIYQTLQYIRNQVYKKDPDQLTKEATDRLSSKGFKVDYVAIADAKTLKEISHWDESRPLVALIAAYNNEVRLIDNLLLN